MNSRENEIVIVFCVYVWGWMVARCVWFMDGYMYVVHGWVYVCLCSSCNVILYLGFKFECKAL